MTFLHLNIPHFQSNLPVLSSKSRKFPSKDRSKSVTLNPSLAKFSTIFLLLSLSNVINANTPLTEQFVEYDLLYNEGYEVAFASRPMWHFGMSRGNKPCYPSSAFDADGNQHRINPSSWPDASSGCPDPGPVGKGSPFPTYYTITRCNPTEIRIVYNLYFPKDGFSNVLLARGHTHDWERIIVIWQLQPSLAPSTTTAENTSPKLWYRSSILKSFHSGYIGEEWSSIQNTIDHSNPSEQGGKNKDGAKIYVGWAKHAMYSTRNTGWNDPGSQGCGREFRSRDWWVIPEARDMLVYAGKGSQMGRRMVDQGVDWGRATSNPVVVEERVCTERDGGFFACGLDAAPVESPTGKAERG